MSGKKYNVKKGVVRIAVFAVSLVIMFVGGLLIGKLGSGKKKDDAVPVLVTEEIIDEVEDVRITISLEEVSKKISDIGELATVEYMYTDAGKFSDKKTFEHIDFLDGVKIPFTEKSFVVRWDGRIKAGIKLEDIECDVDNDAMTITVHMPKAVILSHEILPDSFETLDESKNIFNQISVDDVNIFVGSSQKHMEKKARENGLLEKAGRNAEVLIRNSLNSSSIISEEYKIVFINKDEH